MTQITIDSNGFPERVQYMIDHLNLTLTSFSEKASINRTVITNLLNGRNAPSIETINKILTAYPEWNPYWLLFNLGNPLKKEDDELPFSTQDEFSENHERLHSPLEIFKNQEEIKRMIVDLNKKSDSEKTIEEIRIFYSDDSFERFRKV